MSEEKKEESTYTYFWGAESPFSQWYKDAPFQAKPLYGPAKILEFKTVEHWMGYNKAYLFGDPQTAERILTVDSPRKARDYTRQIKGYESGKWNDRRLEIAIKGNYHKFDQNRKQRNRLLVTGTMVFANPSDKIWGCGCRERDIKTPGEWPGQNLLGECLETVKKQLREA